MNHGLDTENYPGRVLNVIKHCSWVILNKEINILTCYLPIIEKMLMKMYFNWKSLCFKLFSLS